MLIGLLSVRRTSKREQVLQALMDEAYHRALMAFPDEDVVVGSRFASPGAFEAFKALDDITPRPGTRAVGEERAWGRRLAKRFAVEGSYDEKTFVVHVEAASGASSTTRRRSRSRSTRRARRAVRLRPGGRAARSSSTAGRWPRISSSSAPASP